MLTEGACISSRVPHFLLPHVKCPCNLKAPQLLERVFTALQTKAWGLVHQTSSAA